MVNHKNCPEGCPCEDAEFNAPRVGLGPLTKFTHCVGCKQPVQRCNCLIAQNMQISGTSIGANRTTPTEVKVTDPVTGGSKGSKPEKYEQIPVWPLSEVSRTYNFGAAKYGRANFLKGYAWSLSTDALLRHINQWRAGQRNDPESGLHHLAHACFHLFALMQFEKDGLGTDDRMFKDEK